VILWGGGTGDAVDGGVVSVMECKRSVYLGGAGQGGLLGFRIDDPTLLSWFKYFVEKKDGNSSSILSLDSK